MVKSEDGLQKSKNLSPKLEAVLSGAKVNDASEHSRELQLAVTLARHLQRRANELQTPAERRQQSELSNDSES